MLRIIVIIIILSLPSQITFHDFDPVKDFISSQPDIAIDLSRTRSQFKDNWDLKRKNFKAGSRRK